MLVVEVFRFANLLELAGIGGLAALDDDFACPGDREAHLIDWLGAAQVDQDFLRVEAGCHPELLHVPTTNE